jgi:hypothetical protein
MSIRDEIAELLQKLYRENTHPSIAVKIARHADLTPDLSYDWDAWAEAKGVCLDDEARPRREDECPDCGHETRATWNHCAECGYDLACSSRQTLGEFIDWETGSLAREYRLACERELKKVAA